MKSLTRDKVTGVVLAGGQSSRFGSNKALHCIEGKSFLKHAVDVLSPFCNEVRISGNQKEYEELTGMHTLKDVYENCGPLSGIHAALQTIKTPYALFLTCDMPFMQAAPLLYMLQEADDVEVVGWSRVFPLLISASLAVELEEALQAGTYQLKRVLFEREKARVLPIPDEWGTFFTNINRRDDLTNIKN